MPNRDAIVQRHVDVNMLALYEELGVCFGRKAETYKPTFREETGRSLRYL